MKVSDNKTEYQKLHTDIADAIFRYLYFVSKKELMEEEAKGAARELASGCIDIVKEIEQND